MIDELGEHCSVGDIASAFDARCAADLTPPSDRSLAGGPVTFHLAAAVAAWSVSVSSYLCVGLFLQVFVEAVGVGHSHLVDGLFPAGNPGSFDESASGSGGSFAFLGPPSSSFIFNIADHQPQRLQR